MDINKPAMNAPSSGPIPIKLVAKVVPIHMNNVKSKNESLFFVRAASFNARGINHFAPVNIINPSHISLASTKGKLFNSKDSPPNIGVIKITIITAIS